MLRPVRMVKDSQAVFFGLSQKPHRPSVMGAGAGEIMDHTMRAPEVLMEGTTAAAQDEAVQYGYPGKPSLDTVVSRVFAKRTGTPQYVASCFL